MAVAVLAGGPVGAADVNRMARDHGLTPKVIRSAREALGVKIERGRGHPVGPRHVERRAAAVCALHRLRQQGRDHSASGLGRRRYRVFAVPVSMTVMTRA